MVTEGLWAEGAILRAGIENSRGFYTSDHNMIANEIDFNKALGKIVNKPQHQERPRTLKSSIKELAKEYNDNLMEIVEHTKTKTNNLLEKIDKLYEVAKEQKRNMSKTRKKIFRKQMDIVMDEMTKMLLSAENKMAKNREKKRGKRKNHWSPNMVYKQSYMTILKTLIKKATTKKNRGKVTAIVDHLQKRDELYGAMGEMGIKTAPHQGARWSEWKAYIQETRANIKQRQKALGSRKRVRERRQIKERIADLDKKWKVNQQLKSYLNYALGRKNNNHKPQVLIQRHATHTELIEDEMEINKIERTVTAKHMGKGRERWYLKFGKFMKEFKTKDKNNS